jgi:hypothetical protein
MNVFALIGDVSTNPFPERNGIKFCLRGGDICHPKGEGNWFAPPYFPKGIWRTYCRIPLLPVLAYRFGRRAGYLGFKVYGADSPAYKHWMPPEDVYAGSLALQISIRPFATLKG